MNPIDLLLMAFQGIVLFVVWNIILTRMGWMGWSKFIMSLLFMTQIPMIWVVLGVILAMAPWPRDKEDPMTVGKTGEKIEHWWTILLNKKREQFVK